MLGHLKFFFFRSCDIVGFYVEECSTLEMHPIQRHTGINKKTPRSISRYGAHKNKINQEKENNMFVLFKGTKVYVSKPIGLPYIYQYF